MQLQFLPLLLLFCCVGLVAASTLTAESALETSNGRDSFERDLKSKNLTLIAEMLDSEKREIERDVFGNIERDLSSIESTPEALNLKAEGENCSAPQASEKCIETRLEHKSPTPPIAYGKRKLGSPPKMRARQPIPQAGWLHGGSFDVESDEDEAGRDTNSYSQARVKRSKMRDTTQYSLNDSGETSKNVIADTEIGEGIESDNLDIGEDCNSVDDFARLRRIQVGIDIDNNKSTCFVEALRSGAAATLSYTFKQMRYRVKVAST
ncbi:hypothetical protein SCHPADRAFT_896887 [Schizopora paradoxa]|uniref:Uncharacterized protein n=1 Tax=Schizopora paradoxa TaxID=27342 RepID=A0A0H2RID9_9AGAM|nr:hypothetical protein SCHPADRAFT_896887 [Schizopora paradoxa]